VTNSSTTATTDEPHHELREELRAWLAENWDPGLSVEVWWRIVGDAGWTAPHLPPEQGGRGLFRTAVNTVRTMFAEAGAPRPPGGLGLLMAAPTILAQGTPEQIERHVPPILRGEANWCQLFSEPGSGSDLAGLTTRADRDGDRWIINGQKVWSSMAHESDYGMLLARTNWDVPKHAGISWFAFKMDQPGVTVRPLREMTGDAVFNEVFFDNAVVDHADLVGGQDNGWTVTQTTLFFERTGLSSGAHAGWPVPGPKGGFWGRNAADAGRDELPTTDIMVRYPELVEFAQRSGKNTDPFVRQDLARLYTINQLARWNGERAKAELARGTDSGVASVGKLIQTMITKTSAALGVSLAGADAMMGIGSGTTKGRFGSAMVFSPASGIYGGTDEIQHNIIAERTLGLPREDLPGKGQPYGEVLRAIRER